MQYRFNRTQPPKPLPPKAWKAFTQDVVRFIASFEPSLPIKTPEISTERLVIEDKFFTGDILTLDRVPDGMTDVCSDIDTSDFPYDEVVRGVVLLAGAHFRGRLQVETDAPKAKLEESRRYLGNCLQRRFVMPPIVTVEAETPISALTHWRQQRETAKNAREKSDQRVETPTPKGLRP